MKTDHARVLILLGGLGIIALLQATVGVRTPSRYGFVGAFLILSAIVGVAYVASRLKRRRALVVTFVVVSLVLTIAALDYAYLRLAPGGTFALDDGCGVLLPLRGFGLVARRTSSNLCELEIPTRQCHAHFSRCDMLENRAQIGMTLSAECRTPWNVLFPYTADVVTVRGVIDPAQHPMLRPHCSDAYLGPGIDQDEDEWTRRPSVQRLRFYRASRESHPPDKYELQMESFCFEGDPEVDCYTFLDSE
jgi:lipid-A-disaccharide synthase-like uncharacterized protein